MPDLIQRCIKNAPEGGIVVDINSGFQKDGQINGALQEAMQFLLFAGFFHKMILFFIGMEGGLRRSSISYWFFKGMEGARQRRGSSIILIWFFN
jgi:hypothetical protein